MKKRFIISSVVSIFLVSLLLIGSTYSIFTSTVPDEDLNVYTTGDLKVVYETNSTMLTAKTPTSVGNSVYLKPYRITVNNTSSNVDYRFDLQLVGTTATTQINSQYIMVQVGKTEAKKYSTCTNNIILNNILLSAGKSIDIDVRVWLSDTIPNTEMGKAFSAKLVVSGEASYKKEGLTDYDSLIAEYKDLFSNHIMDLYNDGSKTTVNIAGDTSKPKVTLNKEKGIMLDNNGEYRYYGANPNNYVTFNGESWRIISVSNVKKSENGTSEKRVKLIRADSIGSFSFDSSNGENSCIGSEGESDWSKSDLKEELNNLYYNQKSGNCYNSSGNNYATCNFSSSSSTKGLSSSARGMIDEALYYLGGYMSGGAGYADFFYTFERGTDVASWNDTACGEPRTARWVGKVGIMYPSDYAYAVDLSVCKKTAFNYSADTTNCKSWLNKSSDEWLISAGGDVRSPVIVDSNGYVSTARYAYYAYIVRPVVYLKANIQYKSGSGTSTSPYQIQ